MDTGDKSLDELFMKTSSFAMMLKPIPLFS